jgi:hypothetical protein
MNGNLKNQNIPITKLRPSLRSLDSFPDRPERRRPMINIPIINPFKMWNDKLASTKEAAFLQGYMMGIRLSKKTYKEVTNGLSSPTENPLGDFKDELVETIKEAFVLGFIQAINRNN